MAKDNAVEHSANLNFNTPDTRTLGSASMRATSAHIVFASRLPQALQTGWVSMTSAMIVMELRKKYVLRW